MSNIRSVLRTSAVAVMACLIGLTLAGAARSAPTTYHAPPPKPTIVLVHGALNRPGESGDSSP